MAATLRAFLNAHECPAGVASTHCGRRFGSGKWYIPADDEPRLWELVASARPVPYLVENTLASGYQPLVMDLDFNSPTEPRTARGCGKR